MNTCMELVFKEHKTVPGLYKKQKSIILFDYKKFKSSRRGGNGFSPWPNIGKYFSVTSELLRFKDVYRNSDQNIKKDL